jgi:hypothetical protein
VDGQIINVAPVSASLAPGIIRPPCWPGPAPYRPRQPQKTVLYQIVQEHLETFLEQARLQTEHGNGYPRFIEQTLNEARSARSSSSCPALG